MTESAFDIWVDGAYFPQRDRMGGGYVVVQPNGIRLSHSFRLPAEGLVASPDAAEYLASIKAIMDQPADQPFDIFCDNVKVIADINSAQQGLIRRGKYKDLRSVLRKVAAEHQVKAYPAAGYHRYAAEAHKLAQAGALLALQR